MVDVLGKLQALQDLNPSCHWFCNKIEAFEPESEESLQITFSHETPRQISQDCFAVFAYDGPEVQQSKDFLVHGIETQLGKCDVCIGEYYRSKKEFIDRLREDYNDDDVEVLVNVFHQHDVERICRGLDDCTRVLQGIPTEERNDSVLTRQSFHAIIEALTSEKFLVDVALVREYLVNPLRLVQTNRVLRVSHYVPAVAEFLVSDSELLRTWATSSLDWHRGTMNQGEFDFAFRGPLNRHLARGFAYPVDPVFVGNLWFGLKMIANRLDSDLITHSLRALEHNIYKLALDHLHVATQGARYIVQTIRTLLQTSSRDFWDALGAINPSTVAEQIFLSRQFNEILHQADERELQDETSPVADMLNWMLPLLSAVSIGQRPPLCRTISSQMMLKLQKGKLSGNTKIACFKEGLKTLVYTMNTCKEDLNMSDMIGLAVVADALGIAKDHFGTILQIVGSPQRDHQNANMENLCVAVVVSTLMLEGRALRITKNMIQSSQNVSTPFSLSLWYETENHMYPGNTSLARAALTALASMVDLGSIEVANASKEAHDFNLTLGRQINLFQRILDRISAFSPSALSSLARHEGVVGSMITIIPSSNLILHESAVELIKSLTGEAFRKEALRKCLEISFRDSLNGFSVAAKRITTASSFDPCSVFLKVCADLLDALCDPQEGLLRQITLTDEKDLGSVTGFWKSTWDTLKMMYDCCELWSLKKVAATDVLKEFVRDVMQLSETLFSHFAVFDNATTVNITKEDIGVATTSVAKQLLSFPSSAMDGITKFLRLKDEYLLRTSVRLVRMLLSALTKESMVLPPTSSDFLAQIVIYDEDESPKKRIGKKSLLDRTEIAGIAFDLEQNLGRPIIEDARAMASFGKSSTAFPSDKSTDVSHNIGSDDAASEPLSRKKRQSTIDFRSWKTQAVTRNNEEKIESKDSNTDKISKGSVVPLSRSTPGLLDRKSVSKQLQTQKTVAQQAAFINERKKQKLEAEKRREEQIAKIKKIMPNSIAGQTSGEGSALSKIGKSGKEHAPMGENMMVSESDSNSDSDDEIDKELFGNVAKPKRSSTNSDISLSRMKQNAPPGPVKKAKVQRSAKDMRARLAPNMTGLWCRILKWDFFHNGDFPPGSATESYSLVTDTFRTSTDYHKAFEALLLLEAWSSLQKSREEGGFRSFEIRILSRITVDSLFEITVALDFAQCKSAGILEADLVILSKGEKPAEDPVAAHCLGRINRIRHKKGVNEITIQVAQRPEVNSWLVQNTTLHASRIESIVTLEREYGALVGLQWYDLCQEIISAQISPMLKYSEERLEKIGKVYKLNTAQAKAVQSAIDNDAFTLIQGPPGSGKTKTIVAIVGALLSDGLRDNSAVAFSGPVSLTNGPTAAPAAPKKLLVCAPSNAAVDELVMRFMDGIKGTSGSFYKPNVVRLGRSDKVNPQVLDRTLDELVDKIINPSGGKSEREMSEIEKAVNAHKAVDQQIKDMYVSFDDAAASGRPTSSEMSLKFEKLKREKQNWSSQIERLRDSGNSATRNADIQKRKVEQKVLSEAHIICATLSGSARESFQHLTIDFETVVIDEAAQCIELSALIPLKYGCSKCIMVGDPKQLPPTVLSREAARFQYEQSLFVRMQRQQPGDVHLLDTQYRMHPAISRFPSKAFYDGRLLDGAQMDELRIRPWHEDSLLSPYRFFDVAGKHETAPKGHSLINRQEVQVAMGLYQRLSSTVTSYDLTGKIGVITPYKSQLRLLIDRFTSSFGPNILKTIEFNTTDAFQGRESEIIIFSCVRASGKGIGFLSDIRRMNVGITRAKSSLWVLGNSQSLVQGEYWKALVEDARDRGLLSTGSILDLLKNTPKIVTSGNTEPKIQNITIHQHKNSSNGTSPMEATVSPRSDSSLMDWTPSEPTVMPDFRRASQKGQLISKSRPNADLPAPSSLDPVPKTAESRNEQLPAQPAKASSAELSVEKALSYTGVDFNTTGEVLQNDYVKENIDHASRENTHIRSKRKRSNSPKMTHSSTAHLPLPASIRKTKNDDAAFIKPRRKR